MNKKLFQNQGNVAVADVINEAGGKAYALPDKAALAQLIVNGYIGDSYYVSAETQLDQIINLVRKINDTEFLAKLAIYARTKGLIKDAPAVLMVAIANDQRISYEFVRSIFNVVIDNSKMLSNFVQVVRSGKMGRKSFGTRCRNLVRQWLNSRTGNQLFHDSTGVTPSFADIIKLTHPRASNEEQNAVFKYLLDGSDSDNLPEVIKDFEAFKKNTEGKLPKNCPFLRLTSLPLTTSNWKELVYNMGAQALRINLASLNKHGVFTDSKAMDYVVNKLSDPNEVRRSRMMPYQLLAAYLNTKEVPNVVRNALQDAMEAAAENIPSFGNKLVLVAVDVSGSMTNPVTGYSGRTSSKVRCVDAASCFASAFARNSSNVDVICFDTRLHKPVFNSRDTIISNAQKFATYGGGGTSCEIATKYAHENGPYNLVIVISDNASWAASYIGRETGLMKYWDLLRRTNKQAKLVLWDLTPSTTSQGANRSDILRVGGISDAAAGVIANFLESNGGQEFFVKQIDSIALPSYN